MHRSFSSLWNISLRFRSIRKVENLRYRLTSAVLLIYLASYLFIRFVFSGYEILGNLCRSPSNKDCVVFAIDTAIYSSSIELLSLGDVELMISALDALYHMSKLGEETCTNIMLIPGSVGSFSFRVAMV